MKKVVVGTGIVCLDCKVDNCVLLKREGKLRLGLIDFDPKTTFILPFESSESDVEIVVKACEQALFVLPSSQRVEEASSCAVHDVFVMTVYSYEFSRYDRKPLEEGSLRRVAPAEQERGR